MFQYSSSSDSDFNDFHYLEQFLDEFYTNSSQSDNHITLRRCSITNTADNHVDTLIKKHTLGQGDTKYDEQVSTITQCTNELTVANNGLKQYSIYQLLNR
jgi:hypothetical protein